MATIPIFQVFHRPEQRPFLDPDFEAFDNVGRSDRLPSFEALVRIASQAELNRKNAWGCMPPTFGQQTGLAGESFRRQVEQNPDYDVWFAAQSAPAYGLFHNTWLQAASRVPKFIDLCQAFFKAAQLQSDLLETIQPVHSFTGAAMIVATPKFWEQYIAFVRAALRRAEQKLSPEVLKALHAPIALESGARIRTSCLNLIVDRLPLVFLQSSSGRSFRVCRIAGGAATDAPDVHVQILTEMRNAACQAKSQWLASCWLNYRDLYLTATLGESWAAKHLKDITPSEIRFAETEQNIVLAKSAEVRGQRRALLDEVHP